MISKDELRTILNDLPSDKLAALDEILVRVPRQNRVPDFSNVAFPIQAAFIEDKERFKMLLCSRRSGKSYGAGLALLRSAFKHPNSNNLFLALTKASAVGIIWKDVLKDIVDKMGLEGVVFKETDHTVTLPNKSTIIISGVDMDEYERKKLFGRKYKLVILDEASSFTIDMNDLVYNVIRPATMDEQGSIMLMGMPSNIMQGLFYEATQDQNPQKPGTWDFMDKEHGTKWRGYRWSALSNPGMADVYTKEMAELRSNNPLIDKVPSFRQHYLGEWVTDETKRVYKFEQYPKGHNTFVGKLPSYGQGSWSYILGIDLGFNDPTAFTIGAYHDHDPHLFILESFSKQHMTFSDVAARVKQLEMNYDFDIMVVDGASKQGVEELKAHYSLPLITADKLGKVDHIELMNADFILGRIKLHEVKCATLIDEYTGLTWREKEGQIIREENPSKSNHCTDSALYMYMRAYQYLSKDIPPPIVHGTPEWRIQQERGIKDSLIREITHRRDPDNPWGNIGAERDSIDWSNE